MRPGAAHASYRYDALGRRIEKRLGETSLTRYGYDQEDLLLELTQLGTVQARWTHGPGIDEPWLLERDLNQNGTFEASERFTYHTDALGSVVALTNSTGQVVERYRYSSFGEPTIRSPGADGLWETADDTALACSAYGNPFLFTGREYDCESGLYYYRARYYDPTTGRFLQEDPLWSTNLYPYVENNPVNYVDPFGEKTYRINNKFNTAVPTDSPASHTFIAVTDKDPVTGREVVVETYSWVNTNWGEWEDPQKQQNLRGAQRAIDSGVGATEKGDESLDPYVEAEFQQRRNEKGGFYTYRGVCKAQADRLVNRAKKR